MIESPRKKLGRPAGTRHSLDALGVARIEKSGLPFSDWCQAFLVQSVDVWDGQHLTLEEFQRTFSEEALCQNGKGYRWQSIVLILPRKNGKTVLLAALALYRLLETDGQPEILLAAASDKQAGRLFDTCVSFILRNPYLLERVIIRQHVGEISRIDGGGKILRMANDPSTLHGYNPSLVICDELHAWTKPAHRKAWAALTTAGAARQLTQTITITTAGPAEDRADGILGRLVTKNELEGETESSPGLTISRNVPAQTIVFNYSAPTKDPADVENMKLANPASWITTAYLARQAANPELSVSEVLQLHGCVWSTGAKAWLPDGTWKMCADEKRVVEDGTSIMVGFDGSYNNDSTALVGCTIEERPHVFVLGVWERPLQARQWVVPRNEVAIAIKEAFERFQVFEMLCDPPGWHREIEEWAEAYGSPPVIPLETNKRRTMSEMCSRLYTAIVTKGVTHDGNPRLSAHMSNATVRETPDGAYITKEDRHSPRKIDLAVATVLAFGRASAVPTSSGFIF